MAFLHGHGRRAATENNRRPRSFSPPPSGQAPSLPARYRSNAEAVFPADGPPSPKIHLHPRHRSKSVRSLSPPPQPSIIRNRRPDASSARQRAGSKKSFLACESLRSRPSRVRGRELKAQSSPPAPFTWLIEPLGHRKLHSLNPLNRGLDPGQPLRSRAQLPDRGNLLQAPGHDLLESKGIEARLLLLQAPLGGRAHLRAG